MGRGGRVWGAMMAISVAQLQDDHPATSGAATLQRHIRSGAPWRPSGSSLSGGIGACRTSRDRRAAHQIATAFAHSCNCARFGVGAGGSVGEGAGHEDSSGQMGRRDSGAWGTEEKAMGGGASVGGGEGRRGERGTSGEGSGLRDRRQRGVQVFRGGRRRGAGIRGGGWERRKGGWRGEGRGGVGGGSSRGRAGRRREKRGGVGGGRRGGEERGREEGEGGRGESGRGGERRGRGREGGGEGKGGEEGGKKKRGGRRMDALPFCHSRK